MRFVYDDGGRQAAGYLGHAGDCVVRAVAIASGRPYQEVYDALAAGAGRERKARGRTARNGIHTSRDWFKAQMRAWGFVWTPTMHIGSGCKVHLVDGELPLGRLVVAVSKHMTAVIDGVIRDTHDSQRSTLWYDGTRNTDGSAHLARIAHRCVYGYWRLA